jgi:hypothetical protein
VRHTCVTVESVVGHVVENKSLWQPEPVSRIRRTALQTKQTTYVKPVAVNSQ